VAQVTQNEFCLRLDDLAEMFHLKVEKAKAELESLGLEVFLSQGRAYVTPENVRRYIQQKGYRYQPQVISFQMLKGGVAKTTSCLNVGLRAAMYGFRVLFLDLDQQANLSFALGVDDLDAPVFLNVLEKKVTLAQAIRPLSPNVGLLPSNLNNSVIERVLLQGVRNLGRVVRGPIEELLGSYDLVLIDTSPSLNALNTAVTCASDTVVLPINPDKFTLFGVQKHLADLEQIREDFGTKFDVKILFTKYDGREAASAAYFQQCLELFGNKMLGHYVRQTADIKNIIGTGKTIYDTKGNAKEDYDRVTRDILTLW
jgi:chromosome partitioning protein